MDFGLKIAGFRIDASEIFNFLGPSHNEWWKLFTARDTVDGTMDIKHFFLQAMKEIAAGMKYLSRKSFIRRDLAPRNILLNDSLICKVWN